MSGFEPHGSASHALRRILGDAGSCAKNGRTAAPECTPPKLLPEAGGAPAILSLYHNGAEAIWLFWRLRFAVIALWQAKSACALPPPRFSGRQGLVKRQVHKTHFSCMQGASTGLLPAAANGSGCGAGLFARHNLFSYYLFKKISGLAIVIRFCVVYNHAVLSVQRAAGSSPLPGWNCLQ